MRSIGATNSARLWSTPSSCLSVSSPSHPRAQRTVPRAHIHQSHHTSPPDLTPHPNMSWQGEHRDTSRHLLPLVHTQRHHQHDPPDHISPQPTSTISSSLPARFPRAPSSASKAASGPPRRDTTCVAISHPARIRRSLCPRSPRIPGQRTSTSTDPQLSQAEQNAITHTLFQKPDEARGESVRVFLDGRASAIGGGATLTAANGVTLAGFKFMTIKAEPDEVVGRKGVSGCGVGFRTCSRSRWRSRVAVRRRDRRCNWTRR